MGVIHHHQLLFVILSLIAISVQAHNITDILWGFSDYSKFNNYLSQTRLADEINTRQRITVLVLKNEAISTLEYKHPLSVVKDALSLHVLLDYFDAVSLHRLSSGTVRATTLYQNTGKATSDSGYVNITDFKGGDVKFRSAAAAESALDSIYTKEVKTIPDELSVLEISNPIIAPGILNAAAPAAADVNITAALEKAGCEKFARLAVWTGVVKTWSQLAAEKGVTLFAPVEEAFRARNLPDLDNLTNAELISLLQYHALGSYVPIGTLKTKKDRIITLATNDANKFDLTVETAGDNVTLVTGRDSARVTDVVIDSVPLSIFTVDNVLLPIEVFGIAPSPAPVVSSRGPIANSPSSPTGSLGGGPVKSPDNESENSTSHKSAGDVEVPALFEALLTVSAVVIVSVFLS